MLHLTLPLQPLDLAEWRQRSAAESDCAELIREPFTLTDARTGELRAVYLTLAGDSVAGPLLSELSFALRRVRYIRNDRTSGLPTTSRIFGYRPRTTIRNDYCSPVTLSDEQPDEHALLCSGARVVGHFYAQFHPTLYAEHQALAGRVLEEYRLEGSAFTSGIVNANNPLRYHHDAGNFQRAWSGMLGFKYQIEGGYLALPEYGIMAEIADQSLFLFDGQSILHGVTPFRQLAPDARRFTVVYYSLKAMWSCEPLSAELDRIRRLRSDRERRRAGLASSAPQQ